MSDFSNYPEQATLHPSVASYQGANIAEIVRLAPTHILVWRGGNKDVDIAKLKNLGFSLYESRINSPEDLLRNIEEIGMFINAEQQASVLKDDVQKQLNQLEETYKDKHKTAIYYLNQHPITGLGNDAWLNALLALCNIENIYANSGSPYPQLQLAHIIRQQPNLIIAGDGASKSQAQTFWQTHKQVLDKPIITANPDAMHRFTPRAISETASVCQRAYL